jgi:fused signal recognition particle receptor
MGEKKGFFSRLVSGLTKTRKNIASGLDSIFHGFSKIDDDFYEELEEILIMGDLGVDTTMNIIEDLQERVKEEHIKEPAECRQLLIDIIKKQMEVDETAYEYENRTSVVLVIGVNGVGKTTTIGKLAAQLKSQNKKVIMAAADTFRAAAIEQLTEWSNRAGVDIIAQQEGSDPAAVIYDACQAAKSRHADVLLCDTAGRLHNKKNLMNELSKIRRVIEREFPEAYLETLIVLDGTTGQNALVQAKQFKEVSDISGIVLTKLDGTAKGGIAIAIQAELGIPVKYIGKIELSVNAGTLNITDIENEHIEVNGKISEVTLQGNKSEIEIDSNLDMQISVLSHEGALEINQLSATSRLTLPADYRFRSTKKGIATHIYYERQGKKVDDFSDAEADNYIEFNGIKSELVIVEAEV